MSHQIKSKKRRKKDNERKIKEKTAADRIKKFKEAVRYGPIFPCCSCEQIMYENGVTKLNENVLRTLKNACDKVDEKFFHRVLGANLGKPDFHVSITENDVSSYVCHTCKKHILKGKLPPMSAANQLALMKVPVSLNLTELESNLISKKILFQKIYQLPKSRMPAVKDKLVNVPIGEMDILNTLVSLPRTPLEGGLVEVKLKRKENYKNVHRQEFIDPKKLYGALDFLKRSGNPHYQFSTNMYEYIERCMLDDPDCFDALFGDLKQLEEKVDRQKSKKLSVLYVNDKDQTWEEIMELKDFLQKLEQEIEERDEIEYRMKDPIRKFQIDYDISVCLTEKYPEAFCATKKEDHEFSVAPGQGKLPENILASENWDILAFPMKHPDGRNGVHHKRESKLSDQYYFVQRIRNKDPRFRNDPSYCFAAALYLEKKNLQRNINVAFLRGKKVQSSNGNYVYSLEDGFSVFDSMSNTPTYWKKAKYEMMAKLDNLGPFQIFWTLSCADKLWDENFTSILAEKGIRILYKFDQNGNEETLVGMEKNNIMCWIPLKEYVQEEMDESVHEILRRNVVTATRNYQHRVKAFIKEIMTHPSSPMLVLHYCAKLEFQGRGAAHNHGTLWLDMNRMEYMMDCDPKEQSEDPNEYNIYDFGTHFHNDEFDFKREIQDALKVCVNRIFPLTLKEYQEREKASKLIRKFGLERMPKYSEDGSDILARFKFIGLKDAFKKFQTNGVLKDYEEKAVLNFVDKFTSVCLAPAVVGSHVVDLVKSVNMHRHTKACRKYSTHCRFSFPKFPTWKTLLSNPNKVCTEHDACQHQKVLNDVMNLLVNENEINELMKSFDKSSETKEEYYMNREKRIKMLLKAAGYDTEEGWNLYMCALSCAKRGYSVIIGRDIDEVFVNSYNPEWITAWQGNLDIQV